MPKKAAIYIRVSTHEQKTGMQLKDLQEYAEWGGYRKRVLQLRVVNQ